MAEKDERDAGRESLVLEQSCIYEINLENRIVSWSGGAELMYGWSKDEATGRPAYELFKTKFHLNMYDFITKTMENYIWKGELEQHKKDGSLIEASSHAILRRDAAGKPEGIIFVNNDITRAKKTEAALRLSEEKLSVTLNSIGDGVLATDTEGRVTFLNPVAEQLTGWTKEKAAGRRVEEIFRIVNYETRKPIAVPVKKTMSNGVTRGLANHTILISQNGRERHIADSCAPIFARDGRVEGAVLVFRDVTERMMQEIALDKTSRALAAAKVAEDEYREYLEGIINTVRESLLVLDKNLKVVSVSRSFCELFGLKPGDVVGQLVYELGSGQWDIPRLREMLEDILPERGRIENLEVSQDFSGIGTRVMLLNARQVQREQGRENFILLAIEDITESRVVSENLKMFSRTLRAISSANQVLMHAKTEKEFLDQVCGIIVKDRVYKLAWVGIAEDDVKKTVRPAARAGFELKYLNKMNITWADTERGRGPTGTAIRSGKTTVCRDITTSPEFRPWREEALKRGYSSLIALPLKSAGRIFGALTLYSADPDPFSEAEVKLLEELAFDLSYGIMLIRTNEKNRAAEWVIKKIATFPKLNPNPISEIGLSGKIQYMNPAFSRLFPDALEEPMEHAWFAGIGGILRAMKGKRKKIIKREQQAGGKHFLQTIVYLPGEKTVRIYGIDITKRKKAEDELQRLYEVMEKKVQQRTSELIASKHLADIGTLAATVAHELRNPLGVINVAAYNLRKKAKARNRDMLKHIANIEKKVAESGQIINNLLVYSRMKLPQFEKTEIGAILLECGDSVKKHFANRKITLRNMLAAVKGVSIDADPLQLKAIFNNLITNAYQAIENKRGFVMIKAFMKPGNILAVSVNDTGIGINRRDMENVFKPFFTKKVKGTGLGLSICRDMVNMHNGTIDIKSSPGRGSTFTVNLPTRRL